MPSQTLFPNAATSAVALPAYGVCGVTDATASDGEAFLTAGLPAAGLDVAIVSPEPIVASGGGQLAFAGNAVYALYNAADGTPSPGETWYAKAGDTQLRSDSADALAEFTVLGDADGTKVRVRRKATGSSDTFTANITGNVSASGDTASADVTDCWVTERNGVAVDPPEQVTAKWADKTTRTVATGQALRAAGVLAGGVYQLHAISCDENAFAWSEPT